MFQPYAPASASPAPPDPTASLRHRPGEHHAGHHRLNPETAAPQPQPAEHTVPRFTFRRRRERIDWRKIASVDVDRVVRDLDLEALEDNLLNVTFCDIEAEDLRGVDANFAKLYRLAQLMLEFVLHTQDFLASSKTDADARLAAAEARVRELEAANEVLGRHSQRRRRIVQSYHTMLDSRSTASYSCWHCGKAFVSGAFLLAHLERRHSEHAPFTLPPGPQASAPSDAESSSDPTDYRRLRQQLDTLQQQYHLLQDRLADGARRDTSRRTADGLEDRLQMEEQRRRELGESYRAELQRFQDDNQRQLKEQEAKHQDFVNQLREEFARKFRDHAADTKQQIRDETDEQTRRRSNLGMLQDEASRSQDAEAMLRLQQQMREQQEAQAQMQGDYERQLLAMSQRHGQQLRGLEEARGRLARDPRTAAVAAASEAGAEAAFQQQLEAAKRQRALEQRELAERLRLQEDARQRAARLLAVAPSSVSDHSDHTAAPSASAAPVPSVSAAAQSRALLPLASQRLLPVPGREDLKSKYPPPADFDFAKMRRESEHKLRSYLGTRGVQPDAAGLSDADARRLQAALEEDSAVDRVRYPDFERERRAAKRELDLIVRNTYRGGPATDPAAPAPQGRSGPLLTVPPVAAPSTESLNQGSGWGDSDGRETPTPGLQPGPPGPKAVAVVVAPAPANPVEDWSGGDGAAGKPSIRGAQFIEDSEDDYELTAVTDSSVTDDEGEEIREIQPIAMPQGRGDADAGDSDALDMSEITETGAESGADDGEGLPPPIPPRSDEEEEEEEMGTISDMSEPVEIPDDDDPSITSLDDSDGWD